MNPFGFPIRVFAFEDRGGAAEDEETRQEHEPRVGLDDMVPDVREKIDRAHGNEGIVIDNYLFGVAAVGTNGTESVVVFPGSLLRR